MYDVIVVGAGPAGSTAAIVLAQHGLRTLLTDRETFPRDKACGDAIPLDCVTQLRELNVAPFSPDDFYSIDHVFLKGPKGARLTMKLAQKPDASPGIISRYVFDNALLQHAIASGAEFCNVHVQGPIIENGQVVGVRAKQGKQEVEFRSKVVIAADGATSVIRRALDASQRPDTEMAIALRGYVETDSDLDPTMDIVFLSEVQPGYAWFFPVGKRRANIGVGLRADVYKKQSLTLDDMMAIYLKTPEIRGRVGQRKPTDLKSWQIPLCLSDQKRIFNGAILTGDAGGFVNPLTGAGIRPAVITGKAAAEATIQAIRATDLSADGLASYDPLWRKDLEADMKRAATVYHVVSFMPALVDAALIATRAIPPLVPYLFGKV